MIFQTLKYGITCALLPFSEELNSVGVNMVCEICLRGSRGIIKIRIKNCMLLSCFFCLFLCISSYQVLQSNVNLTVTNLREIDEDALEQALSAAVTCTILAAAGPQRSRVLATLYKVSVNISTP